MRRPSRQLNIFSVSALDLFASAMGAFIILAVILFPYFLKLQDSPSHSEMQRIAEKVAAAKSTLESQENKLGQTKEKIDALKPKDIEVVFVLDTTMSMSRHIEGIKRHLSDVAETLSMLNKRTRMGFVAYRDANEYAKTGKGYAAITHPLREMTPNNLRSLNQFVSRLGVASGGYTPPESLSLGLEKAQAMNWSSSRAKQIIVVLTDAAAIDEAKGLRLAESFANSGSNKRKISVILANTEHAHMGRPYLQKLAETGNGEFIEDSGRILGSLLQATLRP